MTVPVKTGSEAAPSATSSASERGGGSPTPTRRAWLRWCERLLFAAGGALLAFYVAARADGWLSSRAALQELDRLEVGKRSSGMKSSGVALPDAQGVDFELWSPERIHAFEESLPSMPENRALAILELEELKLRVPVFAGTDELTLNRGAGWIEGTAMPGTVDDASNVGIAAHRDGFFRGLMHVEVGDPIRLRAGGETMDYRIDGIEIVDPEDVSVLLPRGAPSLTLVTCYPFYYVGSAPRRFIVHAALEKPGPDP